MRASFLWGLVGLGLLTIAGGSVANVQPRSGFELSSNPPPALTQSDVGAWLDGFMSAAMQRDHIPGAAIVVVKDGQVIFEKGYGYADLNSKTPITPSTVFRAGSVSKLFTWTAVMQLVEAGKLNLDRDVGAYLDFPLPHTFGKPITLRELMTHTAGFADTMKGSGPRDVSDLKPLGVYLRDHIPPEIFPPGKVPAYSNYGCSLAGYIVQRVSGEPFESYVERHILQPLGMSNSTFQQPLPPRLQANLAVGYLPGGTKPWYFEPINPIPAGALSTTVADMARFSIAQLQNGKFDNAQIMSTSTAELMHRASFRMPKPLNGMALGFMEMNRNGQNIIGHSGATAVFRTDLVLFLNDGTGYFVAQNSPGDSQSGELDELLFKRFSDRYFPKTIPSEKTISSAVDDDQLVAGNYRPTRRLDNTFLGALSLIGQGWFSPIRLIANPNNTITFSGFGPSREYHEIAPLQWRAVDGKDLLAVAMSGGKVIGFRTNDVPGIILFQPLPWWRGVWNGAALFASVFVLLLVVLGWPITAIIRHRYNATVELGHSEKLARRFVYLAAASDLLLIVGWFAFVFTCISDISNMTSVHDVWLRVLQLLGLLAICGLLVAICNAVLTCRSDRDWISKSFSIAIAFAFAYMVWFEFVGHLMTLNLNY